MVLLFILLAAIGLYFIKWSPYYIKSLSAASTQSLGASVLDDGQTAPLSAALAYAGAYFTAIWKAALLAAILGSFIHVAMRREWLLRLFGRSGWTSAVRGAAVALPGMMCTCCAAPLAVAMRMKQVPAAAALAFFVASPVLNPATLLFMGFVLGWEFSLLRLCAGAVLVLAVALVAERLSGRTTSGAAVLPDGEDSEGRFLVRWARQMWAFILRTLPVHVVMVLLLGAARVWMLPQGEIDGWNDPAWLLPLAIAGTLFAIPTAAEIPIVHALMSLGLETAPAVVLLITLPAVSLPSLLMLRNSVKDSVLLATAALTMLVGIAGAAAGVALL